MRIILGLGNPGRDYAKTRHNCGFMVCEALAQRHGLAPWTNRWQALLTDWPGRGDEAPTLLALPQTFMNRSGEVAQALVAFYKLPPTDLLVVLDDIHLPLGTLRLRGEGSAGGHNGLKDIIQRLGPNVPRLRLGVGQPPPGHDQIAYVLGRFNEAEEAPLQAMLLRAQDAVDDWRRHGLSVATRINGPLPGEKPAKPKPPPASEPTQA